MGTEINLTVDGVTLCWSKNHLGINHGVLFQKTDYKFDDDLEGCSYDEDDENRCLQSSLKKVGNRVQLLGYSHKTALEEVEQQIKTITDDEFWDVDINDVIDYETYGIKSLRSLFGSYTWPAEFQELISKSQFNDRQLIALYEGLSPYCILYLLSQCETTNSKYVKWDFCHIVNAGWVKPEEIKTGLPVQDQFLVVTEGSTDANILRHALKLLQPHIADFFYFVDKDYPFSSVSNLAKFIKGLNCIKVANNVIAVFDNDAAGIEHYDDALGQKLPPNIKLMLLPELEEFSRFKTCGPDGDGTNDINGAAVAIECFLDLTWKSNDEAVIRWGGYNSKSRRYQGSLKNKDNYSKAFLGLKKKESNYDFSKLRVLLDELIGQAAEMKSEMRIADLREQTWR